MFQAWGPAAEAELEYRREGARRALGAGRRRWLRRRRRPAEQPKKDATATRAMQIERALRVVREQAARVTQAPASVEACGEAA